MSGHWYTKMLNPAAVIICSVLSHGLVTTTVQAAEGIAPLGQHRWLASEAAGLVWYRDGKPQGLMKAGQFAQLDSVVLDEHHVLVAGINRSSNSVELWQYGLKGLLSLANFGYGKAELNGLCLYHNPQEQAVYAFVIGANSGIEQRQIYDLQHQRAVDTLIRTLPGAPGLSSCAVDDVRHHLYLAEEQVGVWKMDARPESDVLRQPVVMLEPFGQLKSEIAALEVTSEGGLLITQPDTTDIALYQNHSLSFLPVGKSDLEFIGAQRQQGEWVIAHGTDDGPLHFSSQVTLDIGAKGPKVYPQIKAVAETTPVARFGDAADDPAIWIHPQQPEKSLILGTDKKSGLGVYQLDGQRVQFLATGRLNNVDIRQNIQLDGRKYDIAVASNRDNNSISLYQIQPSGVVEYSTDVQTSLKEVYGICSYTSSKSGENSIFINDKDGRYQQYKLIMNKGHLSAERVRSFKLPDQPEGCVANDQTGELFVGVEDMGIWVLNAEASASTEMTMVDEVGPHLKDDVEGLGLYITDQHRYLVVSSQGNNTFTLYHAQAPYEYAGRFQIRGNLELGIDGVSETDGLEVTSANLGGAFSQGLLVVQDGHNVMPVEPQNFKLIPFSAVLEKVLEAPSSD